MEGYSELLNLQNSNIHYLNSGIKKTGDIHNDTRSLLIGVYLVDPSQGPCDLFLEYVGTPSLFTQNRNLAYLRERTRRVVFNVTR